MLKLLWYPESGGYGAPMVQLLSGQLLQTDDGIAVPSVIH